MAICLLALLIGVVAGLPAMTAPALVGWAACRGGLNLQGGWPGGAALVVAAAT